MRAIAWLLALLLVGPVAAMAATEAARVAVRTGEHADHSRIVFDWTSPVGATVETPEPGQLIVRFDRAARFDLGKAKLSKLTRVAAIAPVAGEPAVRITLRGAHGHKLMTVGTKIVVDILGDPAGRAPAKKAITKKTAKTNNQEQAQYSNHGTAASPPVDAASSGRPAKAHEDEAPPLAPSSSTTAPAGRPDVISDGLPWTEPAREPAGRPAEPEQPMPDPLFDPAAWRGDGSYLEGSARLAERIAAAPQDGATLLALAQFQFAWRHADEALSVLDSIARHDPALAKRGEVRALGDAALLLAGRPGAVGGMFERPALQGRPEVQLWRGASAALSGSSEEAFAAFTKGRPALDRYPANFRSFFGLLAMQAAIDIGAFREAQSFARSFETELSDPDEAAMLDALTGLRLSRQGQAAEARPFLLKAIRSPALKPQVIARLAMIEIDRASGALDKAGAVKALEQLAYSWEGDGLQLEILSRLMEAYVGQRRFDDAFNSAAIARHQFPNDPRTAKMVADARQLFRELLAGDGKTLDPIEAMALYNGHPELMPDGAEAAAIKRGLARQLAALDLAEPAAQLYQEAPAFKAAGSEAATTAPAAAPDDARQRADKSWRSGQWVEAGDGYLLAAESEAAAERKAPLLLRAAAAFLLAGRTEDLQMLRDEHGAEMAKSPVAAVFDQLTAPGAGVELLALPEISAAVVKLP